MSHTLNISFVIALMLILLWRQIMAIHQSCVSTASLLFQRCRTLGNECFIASLFDCT